MNQESPHSMWGETTSVWSGVWACLHCLDALCRVVLIPTLLHQWFIIGSFCSREYSSTAPSLRVPQSSVLNRPGVHNIRYAIAGPNWAEGHYYNSTLNNYPSNYGYRKIRLIVNNEPWQRPIVLRIAIAGTEFLLLEGSLFEQSTWFFTLSLPCTSLNLTSDVLRSVSL